MQLANQEAQRFNHEYIGTEHILLGLVKEGSGVAANVLKNLNIDLRKIRLEVEKIVQSAPEMVPMGKLPHSPGLKRLLEYSIEEARNLHHNYVGTEHLLLGLLREPEDIAYQVLMILLGDVDNVRLALQQLRGHYYFRQPEETLQDLPAETVQAVRELEAQIESLNLEKEEAVAACEFERAARLRDQADKLKKQSAALIVEALRRSGQDPNRHDS
jgi:ATP-dependent Clp protease ATP-binding subunit ClpA